MSFAGTWMELKAIIFSKLIQEEKSSYHMFPLISESYMLVTHGCKDDKSRNWGLLDEKGRDGGGKG